MVNYVKSAATAKRLIEANGQDVSLYRKNETAGDATKPWRGPSGTGNKLIATVKGVVVDMNDKDVDGTLIRRSDRKLMVANDSLPTGTTTEDIDHIRISGEDYKVVSSSPLQPGSVRILYEFILRR
jgi:hypothetical protein